MNAIKRVLGVSSRPLGLVKANPYINQGTSTQQVIYPPSEQFGNRYIEKLKEPLEITLMGKEELATDTFVYRFALPD